MRLQNLGEKEVYVEINNEIREDAREMKEGIQVLRIKHNFYREVDQTSIQENL